MLILSVLGLYNNTGISVITSPSLREREIHEQKAVVCLIDLRFQGRNKTGIADSPSLHRSPTSFSPYPLILDLKDL